MLDTHRESKKSIPLPPTQTFDQKSQVQYDQINPFSYHDNRNIIQLKGEYLGTVSLSLCSIECYNLHVVAFNTLHILVYFTNIALNLKIDNYLPGLVICVFLTGSLTFLTLVLAGSCFWYNLLKRHISSGVFYLVRCFTCAPDSFELVCWSTWHRSLRRGLIVEWKNLETGAKLHWS